MNTTPAWRKSSKCANGTCVEVAHHNGAVLVRDSKHNDSPILNFGPAGWDAFLAGIRNGEYDRR